MKAVQVVARSQPEFVEMPKPELQAGHALIKTLRLSLCGSDIRYIHNLSDDAYPSPPGATGHEMVGIIEDIPPNDAGFKVGDKVLALAPDHLAMTEYYLTPIPDLFHLVDDVPIEYQVQAQQFGTVIYASKRLPDVHGKTVAVIGQGSAGLWFNTVLQDLGAKSIIALDLKSYRLQISSHFGATHTIHNAEVDPVEALKEINNGELADVVIEVAGEKPAASLAVDLVKHSGFILYFGVPRYDHVEFPMLQFFFKCITASAIVGASHEVGHTSTRKALDWITSGKIDIKPMITHTMPFKDVLQAYELHRLQDEGAVKIVIDMEDMDVPS